MPKKGRELPVLRIGAGVGGVEPSCTGLGRSKNGLNGAGLADRLLSEQRALAARYRSGSATSRSACAASIARGKPAVTVVRYTTSLSSSRVTPRRSA